MMRAGPCPSSGSGVANPWYGRPVGPIGVSPAVFGFVVFFAVLAATLSRSRPCCPLDSSDDAA